MKSKYRIVKIEKVKNGRIMQLRKIACTRVLNYICIAN